MIEFKLIPVDEKPISEKKKGKRKFKKDELEIAYRKKEFPRVYGADKSYKADYIQKIFDDMDKKEKDKEKE